MQTKITEKIEGILNTRLASGNTFEVGTFLREMQQKIEQLEVKIEQLEGK